MGGRNFTKILALPTLADNIGTQFMLATLDDWDFLYDCVLEQLDIAKTAISLISTTLLNSYEIGKL